MSLPLPYYASRLFAVAKRGRGLLEYRAAPPSENSSMSYISEPLGTSRYAGCEFCGEARDIPNRPMSQMKPASSRATAMIATCAVLPRATSLR
jgi:hypothetical protein